MLGYFIILAIMFINFYILAQIRGQACTAGTRDVTPEREDNETQIQMQKSSAR